MKQLITCLLLLLVSSYVFTQNSNIIIFTNLPEAKFIAKINGLAQNDKYETSINIKGVESKPYKLYIEFEAASVKPIDKTIEVQPYMEYTLEVKAKSDAAQKAGKFGKNIARDITLRDRDTTELQDLYSLDLISANPLRKASADSYSSKTVETNNPDKEVVSDEKVTYTTNTNVSGNPNTNNANMNVTSGGANISVSISGNTTGNYQETNSNTTTTTEHYIMPGYSGAVGCPWPMQPNDFAAAKNTIASKSFEDSKLTVAKQIINSNCLFADQVKEIMMLFTFEDSKLDFAKYSWHRTFDKGNYFKVNDAFEFESSIDELSNYMNQNP